MMNLLSVRIITENVNQLVGFYELVTEVAATRYTDDFAELSTSSATLAIGSTRTLQFFGGDEVAAAAQNRSLIIEFITQDVDAVYKRLAPLLAGQIIQAPATMPWG